MLKKEVSEPFILKQKYIIILELVFSLVWISEGLTESLLFLVPDLTSTIEIARGLLIVIVPLAMLSVVHPFDLVGFFLLPAAMINIIHSIDPSLVILIYYGFGGIGLYLVYVRRMSLKNVNKHIPQRAGPVKIEELTFLEYLQLLPKVNLSDRSLSTLIGFMSTRRHQQYVVCNPQGKALGLITLQRLLTIPTEDRTTLSISDQIKSWFIPLSRRSSDLTNFAEARSLPTLLLLKEEQFSHVLIYSPEPSNDPLQIVTLPV